MVKELNFKGCMAPVFTPFLRTTGEVNLPIIKTYASHLSNKGVDGVLVNGTVGEGVCMSVGERKTVLEAWLAATQSSSVHVMVHIGGVSLRDVQELAKHAEDKGASSILCLPDLFHRPTSVEELVHYLTLVSQAAPNTPLLYYHYPAHTGVTLNMADFLKAGAKKIPTLAGLKFTHNNLEEAVRCIQLKEKFSIFLGNDYLISAGYFSGLESLIATTMNMMAPKVLEIQFSVKNMDTQKARLQQFDLNSAIDTITKYGKWVPAMKEAMHIVTGLDLGAAREPQGTLTADQVAQLKADLTRLNVSSYY